MPVCLILGSLLKDMCCMLTVGMLVLKANFIHIKFLKCLIQNVLQDMYLLTNLVTFNVQTTDKIIVAPVMSYVFTNIVL